MTRRPRLLNDGEMRDFIVNGYVTVQTDFPAEFHNEIYRQATTIFETEGNPRNDIYPKIPQLADVFGHPQRSRRADKHFGVQLCHASAPSLPSYPTWKTSAGPSQRQL